jgi:hypothetical protein
MRMAADSIFQMPADDSLHPRPRGLRPVAIAWKQLKAVETLEGRSNQHELNATKSLEAVLGVARGREKFDTKFVYLNDDDDTLSSDGQCTYYDSRDAHPTRSELRLYFPTNAVTEAMHEGDLAILFLRDDSSLAFVVCRKGSQSDLQIRSLLNLDSDGDYRMSGLTAEQVSSLSISPRLRPLAIALGLTSNPTSAAVLEEALALNGGDFPTTRQMSDLAARHAEIPEGADADLKLQLLVAEEEAIFLKVEEVLLRKQLDEGFRDVARFVDVAKSVLNRRKSRAGTSLQNHVHRILRDHALPVEPQATTEGKERPDFLLPSAAAYHDASFPTHRLAMLAVKRTCKDRWRQVTTEANRIDQKHLLTLEAGISEPQLRSMMHDHHLIVAMPREVRDSYPPHLRASILTIGELIEDLRRRALP